MRLILKRYFLGLKSLYNPVAFDSVFTILKIYPSMGDESRNQQRDVLAQEAIKKLPKSQAISLDYIKKCAKRDTLLFLPAVDVKYRLVNEWLIAFNNTMIVSTNPSILRKNIVTNISTTEDLRAEKKKYNNVLISLSEFMLGSTSFSNPTPVILFDEINDINEIEAIKMHPLYKAAILKGLVTESPVLFTHYLKNITSDFECYTSNLFLRTSHYRSIIETSDFFYFDDSSARMNDFKNRIHDISKLDLSIVEFLLDHGLFYSFLFNETVLVSDKFHCLLRIIELLDGDCLVVYLKDEIEERIVHELLNVHAGGDKDVSREIIRGLINGTAPKVQIAHSNIIIRKKSPVNVQFIRNPNRLRGLIHPLILFDFCNVTAPMKVFILPESERGTIRQLAIDESNMAKTYSDYVRRIQMANPTSIDPPAALHRFELLTKDIQIVRRNAKDKGFIHSVVMEDGYVRVTARCRIGKIPTCFNLLSTLHEPVVIPRMCQPISIAMVSDKVELCTITTPKTQCNTKAIQGNGYVMITLRGITVFSLSRERNLMIEIDAEDIEDYVMISTNRWQQKRVMIQRSQGYDNLINRKRELEGGESTLKTYHNLVMNKHIPKDSITVSLCLKIKPRVYTIPQLAEIAAEITSESSISEKCQGLTSLGWRRLSADDFPDFNERFDVRISIPCTQDIQPELLERFIYHCKDFTNNMDDRMLDQLAYTIKNTHLAGILGVLSSYPAKIIATEFTKSAIPLSLKEMQESFLTKSFDDFFAITSLISRKGRHLISKIDRSDIEHIAVQDIPSYCAELDRQLSSRFKNVNFKEIKTSGNEMKPRTRIATITPLSVTFDYEIGVISNRVLRNFDADKFCRVIIREEDRKRKFREKSTRDAEHFYDYLRKVMLQGLVIGTRKYFFLTLTGSQLKSHSAWFITPYEKDGVMIGADYIKSWIGNFNKIKNIGKYAVRIGLALSTTTSTFRFDNFIEISDINKYSYCFTDGIGLINRRSAALVSQKLGLDYIPSAFQIRFGGYKGMLAVHHWLDDAASYLTWIEANKVEIVHDNSQVSKENSKNTAAGSRLVGDALPDIIFRSSMNKFWSINHDLEVIIASKPSNFYLNRQIIMVLEGLGVPAQVFIDLQDQYIRTHILQLSGDFSSFIRKFVGGLPNIAMDLPFHRKLQVPIISRVFEELNSKAKILIKQGRGGIGVLDELGILEDNEIFCMFRKDDEENMDGLRDYGSYVVPIGQCIIAKNPVTHPGDVRVVRCVDIAQLHYMKDVIVFSKKGTRPVFNQCSGSDLDGDIFLISWCKALIPKATFKPYSYVDACALTKEQVLLSDIVNFLVRFMKFDRLGEIANAHLAIADRFSLFSEKALKLAEAFNKNIDHVKTGQVVAIPEDLVPREYPDFMEQCPSYYSTKTLGYLYRRSTFDLSVIRSCECRSCSIREIQQQMRWRSFILLGSGVKTREISAPYDDFCSTYALIYEDYVNDIKLLMDKAGVRTEEELFCMNDSEVKIRQQLRHLIAKYIEILRNKNAQKMARVCGCREFSGIVGLCGDSYKLKSLIVKGVVKEGDSPFIFNSKIVPCTEDEVEFEGYVESFYQNGWEDDCIKVKCDIEKYKQLAKGLDAKREELFRDLFNLSLLGGLYRIDEVDQILDLLLRINEAMRDSTVDDILRVAIPGSNDKLFRVLCLLPLDLSIVKKSLLLREKTLLKSNVRENGHKLCKRQGLIIGGMQDENEDIEFIMDMNVMIPRLRNKGICSPKYYKGMIRDFLVNILYSNENLKFIERGTASYEIYFTPGKFFFPDVPEAYMSDRFSVKSIEKMLTNGKLSYGFTSTHKVLHGDKAMEFLKGLKGVSRSIKETLSFNYKNIRYDVEIQNGKLKRISKDKKILGRMHLVRDDGDMQTELFRKEIIYDDTVKKLIDEEVFMRGELFTTDGNEGYKLLFDNGVFQCTKIKLERSTLFSDKNGFEIVNKELFLGNERLEYRGKKTYCHVSKEFSLENIDGFSFDGIFWKLWKVYSGLGLFE